MENELPLQCQACLEAIKHGYRGDGRPVVKKGESRTSLSSESDFDLQCQNLKESGQCAAHLSLKSRPPIDTSSVNPEGI